MKIVNSINSNIFDNLSNSIKEYINIFPPVTENLLAFLRGDSSETEKLDNYKKPLAENFVMSQSHCVSLDGVTVYGISVKELSLGSKFYVSILAILPFGEPAKNRIVSYEPENTSPGTFSLETHDTEDRIDFIIYPVDGVRSVFTLKEGGIYDNKQHLYEIFYDAGDLKVDIDGYQEVRKTIDNASGFPLSKISVGKLGLLSVANLIVNDTRFPFAEGAGIISYSTDNTNQVDWVGGSELIWSNKQDGNHYNSVNGYGYRQQQFENSGDMTVQLLTDCTPTLLGDGWWSVLLDTDNQGIVGTTRNQGYTEVAYPMYKRMGLNSVAREVYATFVDSAGTRWGICVTTKSAENNTSNYTCMSAKEDSDGSLLSKLIYGYESPNEILMKDPVVVKVDESLIQDIGTVVCIGDSITSGNYPLRLVELFPDANIIDSGVGGDTIRMMIDRFDDDVSAHNPDKISILAGANDVAWSRKLEQLQDDFSELLSLCEGTTAKEIIINTLIPRTGWNDFQQSVHLEFNHWLRSLGHTICEQYYHMLEPGSTTDLCYNYTVDGIHPTAYSRDFMGDEIAKLWGFSYPKYVETRVELVYGTEKLPFIDDNKGGTFNNSETSFAPASTPIGTFDGTDDYILMYENHDEILSYEGTAEPTYTSPNVTVTAGTLKEIEFSDGILMPMQEGSGSILYSPSYGNLDKENLAKWSEDFSNSVWRESGMILSTSELTEEDVDSSHFMYINTGFSGTRFNFEIEVKSNGRGLIQIISLASNLDYANFDIINGVVTKVGEETSDIDCAIVDIGDGWFRCSAYVKPSGSGGLGIAIIQNTYDSWLPAYQGDGVSGVFANTIQINSGVNKIPYIKTENYIYKLERGRSVGEVVSSDVDAFWNTDPGIVSKEIIDLESVKDIPVFTDGNWHSVPMTQSEFEANDEINTNKQDYMRTGSKVEVAIFAQKLSVENDAIMLKWAES